VTDDQPVTVLLAITIQPWLLDHRFEGVAIFPAAEMLQHMARAVQTHSPGAPVTCLQRASFSRFLLIEPSCTIIELFCNLSIAAGGVIRTTFTTAAKVGSGAVTRMKDHATVFFAPTASPVIGLSAEALAALHIPGFEIPARLLYGELIPFGPAFQSVHEKVVLTESAAVARVCAHPLPGAMGPLGSPFPFDGSLHAACAWAQRYCGIVAFPVGFDGRMIVQPITPGETVNCTAIPVSVHEGVIKFDIWLFDQDGTVREMVKGVAMKDVSRGRMTPPAWMRSDLSVRLV
jgi:hypothetical protein